MMLHLKVCLRIGYPEISSLIIVFHFAPPYSGQKLLVLDTQNQILHCLINGGVHKWDTQ